MTRPEFFAGIMLVAMGLYALLGGADFGGGVWDLLSQGPRKKAQQKVIEKAIAPVWEANHVWLILVIVLLFSVFPRAFAVTSIALHVPLTLFLIGIVLRGSAFVFRQYGSQDDRTFFIWGRVFSIASVVSPVCLGIVLGALSNGSMTDEHGEAVHDLLAGWLAPFPWIVGFLSLSLFAFLSAVYLTNETEDAELQNDFRLRAYGALVVSTVLAGIGLQLTTHVVNPWIQASAAIVAVLVWTTLWLHQFRLARVFAVALLSLVMLGFALYQRPFLIRPAITVFNAAAPDALLSLLTPVLGVGALFLIPSLYFLMRTFKSGRQKS